MSVITSRATTGAIAGTGTITTTTSSTSVTGQSSLFLTEVLVGQALYTSGDVYIGTVSAVTSNTALTLTANGAVAGAAQSYKVGYKPVNVPLTNAQIDTNFININNGKVETSAVDTANTANKIVKRDGSGNFAAGTITAALSGNASTATTLQTTRKINNVDFNGSADILTPAIWDSSYIRIVNPGGAQATSTSSSVTGAIAITLPVAMTSTMMSFRVKVFDYSTNNSFTVDVSGYNYTTGNTWVNCTASIVGSPSANRAFNVRFGYTSGSKAIVYIGELNTVWSYPQVAVTEVLCGYTGQSLSWTSGWSIGYEASAFQNVTVTVSGSDAQVGYGSSSNTASSLVKRDASGNFSAGTITANLTGNASGSAATFTSTSQNSQFNSVGVGTAASGTAGEIRATNTITSWYSDERLKENIKPIENALQKLEQLVGVTFNANQLAESFGYTDKSSQVGVLAGDVEKVLPEAVKFAPFDRIIYEGTEISKSGQNYKTVQYEKLVPLIIEAIKDLSEQIKEIKGVK